MSDSKGKKLTVMVPAETYLKAVGKMTPVGLKFQGLLLGLLEKWVDAETSAGDLSKRSVPSIESVNPKQEQMITNFKQFLASAPAADVHMVMSLIARFSESDLALQSDTKRKVNRR